VLQWLAVMLGTKAIWLVLTNLEIDQAAGHHLSQHSPLRTKQNVIAFRSQNNADTDETMSKLWIKSEQNLTIVFHPRIN
jgi:hypothetical protein